MSTARRRPTGGLRRPQVAGRPRSTSGTTEPDETTDGVLAVEERADARGRTLTAPAVDDDQAGARIPAAGRSRTVTRPGTRQDADEAAAPAGTEPELDDPSPADGAGPDQRDEADRAAGLPSAPAVRSDESGPRADGAGLAARLRRIPLPSAPATRRGTAALLAVTILLVAAAGFFAVSWARLQFSSSTANTALTDVGATATVSEQVGEAVTKVYSFDYARLDQAESDARGVITGPFNAQFDQIFGNVRQLAPKQQAVVTATIPKSAVASIDGDRATVYTFVNQVVRRVDDGGRPQQGTAAARLRVDAEYVDGRWKISGMTPA